ncbi:MAG: putative NAD(P)H nitroreductase YodC [Syntrophus sp. PtaU1.Bin208]|nr:MAG: putative NAD(P)H nitroreductase YodC [Syntrophus sp. PtaU1.Bin208]
MELSAAIRERKSIRAFKPDPVSREQVEHILALAVLAPSAINLQPWEFTVVMGEEKARLSRRLIKAFREKQISCSPGNVKPLSKAFSRRGVESFEVMNPCLTRMGLDFNTFINEGSCNFYGAPAGIILCLDNAFSRARLVDIGITLGYLVLAAHDQGLGTCPIGLINAYEDDVKDLLNIPEEKDVVIAVALGHPDWESPLNAFRTPRESLDSFVRWID